MDFKINTYVRIRPYFTSMSDTKAPPINFELLSFDKIFARLFSLFYMFLDGLGDSVLSFSANDDFILSSLTRSDEEFQFGFTKVCVF